MINQKKNINPWIILLISAVISVLITFCIAWFGPALQRFPHLPDQGPAWYYWKLPLAAFWATLTSWLGYSLHQVSLWLITAAALRRKKTDESFSGLNWIALGTNLIFIVLHFFQTHLFYDGLAQQMPIWTSQFSVIGMLFIILILLTQRRGFILGLPLPFSSKALGFIKKYHGYYISWALVYTFWFHPMENTVGILAGFLYMFLLLIHFSFMHTAVHTNMRWIAFLEFFVGVHGTLIAFSNAAALWPMFCFGFLFMTAFTQIFGFKMKQALSFLFTALFIIGVILFYAINNRLGRIYEVTFIPFTLYAGSILLVWIIQFGQWTVEKLSKEKSF